VAIVTNIGQGDHLGLNYITTVEDLAVVKRVIVENVAPTGTAVLNAADPIVAGMADSSPGSVIFFAVDRYHPTMVAHRSLGKRVVFVQDNEIVAAEAGFEHHIPLTGIPITRSGTIGFQVENAMAATAACWALGIGWDVIAGGLASFINDAATAPGRFNLFTYRGATVIADYGHNADAILALVRALDAMPSIRRSVVISAAGDRRDEDIRRQTEILGDAFDDIILYEDACQRGRQDGEVVAILKDGLKQAARTRRIEDIRGEFLAIDTALTRLQPGDLCLVLIDQVEEALGHISRRIEEG
jgi:cyanophycin synthetase